jgi:hypothetical protein
MMPMMAVGGVAVAAIAVAVVMNLPGLRDANGGTPPTNGVISPTGPTGPTGNTGTTGGTGDGVNAPTGGRGTAGRGDDRGGTGAANGRAGATGATGTTGSTGTTTPDPGALALRAALDRLDTLSIDPESARRAVALADSLESLTRGETRVELLYRRASARYLLSDKQRSCQDLAVALAVASDSSVYRRAVGRLRTDQGC